MKLRFPKKYPFSPIREIKELQEILFKKESHSIDVKVEDVLEDKTETFSTPKSYVSNCETDNKSVYILPLELPPPQLITEITEAEAVEETECLIYKNNEIIRNQLEAIDAYKRELTDLEGIIRERSAVAEYYAQMYYHNEAMLHEITKQVTHCQQLVDSFSLLTQNPDYFNNMMITHLVNQLTPQ